MNHINRNFVLFLMTVWFSANLHATPVTTIDFDKFFESFEAPEVQEARINLESISTDAVQATADYAGLFETARDSSSSLGAYLTVFNTTLNGVLAAKSIYDVSNQSDLDGIQSVFSFTTTGDALDNAETINSTIQNLTESLRGKVFQPTADVYITAAVDKKTRSDMEALLPKLDVMLSDNDSAYDLISEIKPAISEARMEASELRDQLETVRTNMNDFVLSQNCEVRFCDPITGKAVILAAQLANTKLVSDISLLDQLISTYDASIYSSNAALAELDRSRNDMISAENTIKSALETPLAQSSYSFSGDFNGAGNIWNGDGYQYQFYGADYQEDGAFLEDNFLVGYLLAWNGYSSKYYYEDYFNITMDRETYFLGETYKSSTTAENILRYTVKEVIGGTEAENADYFLFPEIEQAAYINEYSTAVFSIYGSINSPLKITDIRYESSGGVEGGFVGPVEVSEPRSLLLAVPALLFLLIARRFRGSGFGGARIA